MHIRTICVMLLVGMMYGRSATAADYIWWEGESTTDTNFPGRSWFDPKPDEKDKLSEGHWLTCDGNRGVKDPELFAKYRVKIDQPGEYHFWTRKFWKHGPFRWRFDNQPWQTCGGDVALADNVTLRTHVCANWVSLGKVKLTRGEHTFELRLLAGPGESRTACFDSFVVSRGVFVPNGKHRPGARMGQADAGRFTWEPANDSFGDDALLDLRLLNELRAGMNGRVRCEGENFVLGDGQPVRFWAVNVGSSNAAQDRASIDYLARKLAKLGVNMVRYHSPLFDPSDPRRIDAKKLDDLHYLVAALARQGIYTHISFYFPLWCDGTKLPGVSGYETIDNKKPFATIYFDPAFQQLYRGWMKGFLTPINPYTKKSLAADPAVAIIEMVNEDSFFFWTFSRKNIPAQHWRALEKKFGTWLGKRDGSIDKAIAKWGGGKQPGDEPGDGYAAIFEAWHMTGGALKQGGEAKRKRISDQVRFLAELQRDFYADTAAYAKQLGYAGLTSASNWHTADASVLDAVERYTYTATDVIDRHGYFDSEHKGDGANYSVREGHTFKDLAGVTVPARLPIQFFQVAGKPQIITELNWTPPNRYRADAVPLTAAYAALQGCDGVYWFAVGSNFLSDRSMNKFPVSCPVIAGSLPAAALMYRQGLVEEAKPVIDQKLLWLDRYELKPSQVYSDAALDQLRQADIPKGEMHGGEIAQLPQFSFYVGKVQRDFVGKPTTSRQADLSKYIDLQSKAIHSITGQMTWRYEQGVVTINASRACGVIGFAAAAGHVKLDGVSIDCKNEYASVLVVAMDGKPIEQSRKVLIQVMTNERPYGFKAEGGRITSLGSYPFGLKKIDCTVGLGAGWAQAKVTPLDENGYRREGGKQSRNTGGQIRLAEDAVYHVVSR